MLYKKIIKHLAILIATSIILYGTHYFVISNYIEDFYKSFIQKQHMFLCVAALFVYGSSLVVYKITPKNTGFVFLGLLMAKMIIAGLFIHQLGWLDDPGSMPSRFIFLFLYLIYSIVLVYIVSRLLKIFSDKSLSQ